MRRYRQGFPELADAPSAYTTLTTMDWATPIVNEYLWADLDLVYTYLRGGKSLKIPREFRNAIPDDLGFTFKEEMAGVQQTSLASVRV